jgi:protein-S-isoprenylcysteine O-methyltransferase Ste14
MPTLKNWLYVIATSGFYAALCFAALCLAGSFDLPFFYLVFGSQLFVGNIASLTLHPDLIAERIKPRGKDKDPVGTPLISFLWMSQFLIACMDVGHWHRFDNVPVVVQVAALLLMTAAWSIVLWSMLTNMYFSSAIRLQQDRGQTVIDTGPYGWMRHPGYAFSVIGFLTEGVALGSWLTIVPALLIVAHLAYRTVLEEKMLQPGLPGYSEYSQRVRFKWIPGLW